MGAITQLYSASSDLVVTNLHSIASSSTWVSGWISAIIDNSTTKYEDIVLSAKLALGNAATAGEIRAYIITMLDDSNWPALLSAGSLGTQGTATVTTTTIRDSAMELMWARSTRADPGTDDVYNMRPTSILSVLGFMPEKSILYLSHSTGVNLAASGNQVTMRGLYRSVA